MCLLCVSHLLVNGEQDRLILIVMELTYKWTKTYNKQIKKEGSDGERAMLEVKWRSMLESDRGRNFSLWNQGRPTKEDLAPNGFRGTENSCNKVATQLLKFSQSGYFKEHPGGGECLGW